MELGLNGRVVCVTGGTRGIGRETVLALLNEGALVATCARTQADLDRRREDASPCSDRLLTVAADVLDEQQMVTFIDAAAAQFGRIDGLIANAGRGSTGRVLDASAADFTAQVSTKVASVLNAVRPAVPHLRRSDAPRIVIVNGVTAHAPEGDMAAVSAARAAVANLAVSLAAELAVDGICVNRMNLGPIVTGRQQARHAESGSPLGFSDWLLAEASRRQVPLGRLGSIAEVVPWLLMKVSPLASFVTGASIDVAGGLGMRV